ncbi:uncharacterized protein EDB93DRAFT_1244769 [Suillus bovinus]|uniref:uncharacterized protein n=1 Tax=Suillus bovinus TaxID=48563 RepID=UPI001B8645A2|nr:uncharacterized protein EDB93DRAFT_1244769 [Suillus bovinus]KAG2160009.1 hypothetical protein EDB93DRAFT_1244769 [Suillus bovinus]
MPCNFVSPSTPLRRRLDLFLRLSPPPSRGCPHFRNLNDTFVPMIFIIFDNYAYELGVKTVLAGILALLLGLLGFVISVFTLGVVWIVPAMGTQAPPYREPIHRSPKKLRGLILTASPESMLQTLPPIPPASKTPSLRRAASFPDLHKTPSPERQPLMTSRHVSFNIGAPESHNPSLARSVSMNPSSMPPAIQRRWPPAMSSFSRRRSTQEESPPSLPTVRDESNTTACNHRSSPTSKSTCVHDLRLDCSDERDECCRGGRRNSLACDEDGRMNLPRGDSFSEGTTSTRSSRAISLRLPSVRKALSRKRRPTSVPPHTPAMVNINAKEQSQQQNPTAVYPVRTSSPPLSPTSGEMYHAEYVNPFRTKKSKVTPKFEGSKSSRRSRFSLSGPWSSTKPAGLSPDLASSSTSPTSIFSNSPSALRKTFTSHFTPFFKSPAINSPSSFESLSPMPSPQLQPYGPPWNAVMPGQYHDLVNGSLDDVLIKGPRHGHKEAEDRRGFKLHSHTLTPIDSSESEYSPDKLVDELVQPPSELTHSQDAITGATAEVAQITPLRL